MRSSFQLVHLCIAVALLCAIAAGCARKEPPPFVAPRGLQTERTHFAGSLLSGPTTRPVASVPPDQALAVHVRFVSLEKMPAAGTPLAASARLIGADRLGTPILFASRLTRGARLLQLPDAAAFDKVVKADVGRSVTLYDTRGALPRGVTSRYAIADQSPLNIQLTGETAHHRLELLIYRPDLRTKPASQAASAPASQPAVAVEAVELALVVEDLAPLPQEADRTADAGKDERPPPVSVVQREVAIVDRAIGESDTVAMILPFQLADSQGRAVAAIVEIRRDPGSPEHMAALSQTIEEGRQSAARTASLPSVLAIAGDPSARLATFLGSLEGGERRRAGVVYLAGQVGAKLCEDAALVADEGTLATLADRATKVSSIAPTITPATSPTTPAPIARLDLPSLGWQLDRATFELLGQLLTDSKLSPELSAVLVAHLGEAGRHPSSIEEISRSMNSRQEFQQRLIEENLIFLEDSSPSARVRAFDWLAARGRAPAGYDPLGPVRERRLAIERAQTAPPPASPATVAPAAAP